MDFEEFQFSPKDCNATGFGGRIVDQDGRFFAGVRDLPAFVRAMAAVVALIDAY